MRIVCDTQSFTNVCLNVQRCIPAKAVLPHLEGIVIRTLEENTIELFGFDLDIASRTTMQVRVEQPGAVVLNAKTFCDILKHLPDETVVIDCDAKNVCSIKSGGVEYTLISLDPEEYPELPTVTNEIPFRISQNVLKDMIRQTIFAVSIDDSKAVHRGIKFEISPGQIQLVALDGFRLAIRREFIEYDGEPFWFVAPAKTLAEIIKLIGDEEGFINISKGKHHIRFTVNNYTITSKLLEGRFLDYTTAIPTVKTATVRVNTRTMIECIERTSIIVTEKVRSPIKFIFDEDMIKMSAVTSLGSANDKMTGSLDGKRTEIGFNNKFILDALRSCDADEVLIELNGSLSPALIVPTDGDHFMYLILPVRIKADE